MERTVIIGGEAGQGVAKAAEILGRALVSSGYYVFNYRDYPSLIRGGHNFNCVTFSDKPVYSHSWEGDLVVGMDARSKGHKGKKRIFLGREEEKNLEKEGISRRNLNMLALGIIWKHFGLPLKILEGVVEKELGEEAKRAVRLGYEKGEKSEELKVLGKRSVYFLTGNQAVALGLVYGGLDIYMAYPMTPATPVLHFLSSVKERFGIKVLQLENEIAVINAALGASYAGAVTAVGTSGGGFSLMAEATSLQGMNEVPLVVYLAQRTGPSTGVPTYTEQGDLMLALFSGQGEFPRVAVAPGDAKEAFERAVEAIHLSQKFRVLSVILGDKHLGESHYTVEVAKPRVRGGRVLEEDELSYRITEDGVSPRWVPGKGKVVRATSYEHDEKGITTEEAEMITRMKDKRARKGRALREFVRGLEPYKIYGKGKKLLVGWGSTKGAILDFISRHRGYSFLQISYLEPFVVPKEVFEEYEEVILVENNQTGLLGKVIAMNTGVLIERKILKYDGRPFTVKDLEGRI